MNKIKPEGHKEIFVHKGEILLQKHENFKLCGKGEWNAINAAKNITFNDTFVTYLDEDNKVQYIELKGWFITVYAYNYTPPKPEPQQLTIFDFI